MFWARRGTKAAWPKGGAISGTCRNLADFLDGCVFKDAQSTTEKPVASDVVGFEDFFARFTKGLPIEHAAIETINLEDK